MKGMTGAEAEEVRDFLDDSINPLFFFHDDPDGFCSYLLLYRLIMRGHGIMVKSVPSVDSRYYAKVKEYRPDRIFVSDLYNVEQDFIDRAKTPVCWLDHHGPNPKKGVRYYNPRLANKNDNIPASVMAYEVNQKDLWLAAIGAIGDWHWPWFAEEFKRRYPSLLPAKVKNPDDALFATPLGRLVFVFSFMLKTRTSLAMQCIEHIAGMDGPEELMEAKTERAVFIMDLFSKVNRKYEDLLSEARQTKPKDGIICWIYAGSKDSFSKDIANRMLYDNQDMVIIVGREKDGLVKMSMRARNFILPPVLEQALQGIEGHGGGHEHACGAQVRADQFKTFLEQFRKAMPK